MRWTSSSAEAPDIEVLARLAAIRRTRLLPESFPAEVVDAANKAAKQTLESFLEDRLDLRELPFQTLDPSTSTDLDQAFFAEMEGSNVVLRYAIADVGAFVNRGDVIETEAWARGMTIYAPDHRISLYPEAISQRAASLLPDGPRPAVVFETVIDAAGSATLRSVTRSVVHSRAKLAYETTELADLPNAVLELHKRMQEAEIRRGATKIDWPEQEVVVDPDAPGGFRLVLRALRPSEEVNAAMSLAVNIAVAQLMHRHEVGLFRVMPEADPRRQAALRRSAQALGVRWPANVSLRELMPSLDPANPRHAKILLDARRAGRGASYACFDAAKPAWHNALATMYAHATAPMRRLADRYVVDLAVTLFRNGSTAECEPALEAMPKVMAAAERTSREVENDVLDLLEAVSLEGRIGEEFAATVIDRGERGVTIQIAEPPVRARSPLPKGSNNNVVVRLVEANVETRKVRFELAEDPT